MDSTPKPRGPGRPRSETTRRAILDAALALAADEPYTAITVDRIAQSARVGKQSIYRWWTSKADVLLDAFAEREAAAPREVGPSGGHAILMLEAAVDRIAAFVTRTTNARILRSLLAEAQLDPDLRTAVDARLIGPQRQILAAVLETGRARGEIRPDVDSATVVDMLTGAIWQRILAGDERPGDGTFARKLVALLTPGLTAGLAVRPPIRMDSALFEA